MLSHCHGRSLQALRRAAPCIATAAPVNNTNIPTHRHFTQLHRTTPTHTSTTRLTTPTHMTSHTRLFASYPEHTILKMPALSPTMEKGNLASWQKSVGDELKVGEVMAEVETDKATVAFEAVEDGYLAKILIEGGTSDVDVGTPVAVIVEEKDDVAAFKDFTISEGESDKKEAAPSVKKQEDKSGEKADQAREADAEKKSEKKSESKQSPPQEQQQQQSSSKSGGHVIASPYAKKLASEQGIDLSSIKGTGPNNRIVADDVHEQGSSASASSGGAKDQPSSSIPVQTSTEPMQGDYTDIKNSNVRKTIAKRLLESKQTIPHYYVTQEIQVDKLLTLRSELNQTLTLADPANAVKLSVNDLIVKAAALALRKVPEVNATWTNDAVRQYNYVDVSVAVATDGGLITPIIRNADKIGLSSISKQTKELAKLAKANKLQPQQYQGGTFTISNLGMFGVTHFTAIINPPQSAILAIGSTQERVVVDKSAATPYSEPKFKVVNVLTVTMSSDHRVIDGAVAAKYLSAFKSLLESPSTMLL